MKAKKYIVVVSMVVLFFIQSFNVTVYAQNVGTSSTTVSETKTEYNLRSPNTGWVYKSVDGKIYRRLYDYTNQKWLTDWQLCP